MTRLCDSISRRKSFSFTALEFLNIHRHLFEAYTAYVKFDFDKMQPRSYRNNPDLKQAKEQIPTIITANTQT